jgi:hypothetical protein
MPNSKKVMIQVQVPLDLFSMIKERANETDRSVANYVRTILRMMHQEEVEEETNVSN